MIKQWRVRRVPAWLLVFVMAIQGLWAAPAAGAVSAVTLNPNRIGAGYPPGVGLALGDHVVQLSPRRHQRQYDQL